MKPEQGGIRTYSRELVAALACEEHDLDVSVITGVPADFQDLNVRCITAPTNTHAFAKRAAWRERNIVRLLRSTGAEVLLSTTIELPFRRLPVPTVMVVLDVGPLIAPAIYTRARWLRYSSLLPRALSTATKVVCISASTLRELYGATGVAPEKCVVIRPAPRPRQRLSETVNTDRNPYLLYVGSMLPHKNVVTVLNAFGDADWLPAVDLRLVGHMSDAETADFSASVARFGVGHRVHHHGFVTDATLDSLYSGATAVVVPTLFEGFGLPLLEAMLAGVPVVASDIPVLREVGGEAPIWVTNPLAPDAWQSAIDDVVALGANERRALLEIGLRDAGEATWSTVGCAFVRLLRDIVAMR